MSPHRLLIAILFLLSVTVVSAQETPEPTLPNSRPTPNLVMIEGGATLELYFDSIAQGQVGVVHLYGTDISSVHATFLENEFEFFPVLEDGYYGLLAVGMEQEVDNYDLTIDVQFADETTGTITTSVEIVLGAFIRQEITVSEDLGYLIDPEVERHELAQLETLFGSFTSEQFWDENGFQWPLETELTSQFGAFRVFNETTSSRHTGWDMRASTGAPVITTAAGRVAFAGVLDLRGNYILIDHGYGIYSGYAHLSVVHVTRGQDVSAGEIIGQVGSSGRSGGAHFHWEMAVNSEWIDSVEFTAMWMPLFNPSMPIIENP